MKTSFHRTAAEPGSRWAIVLEGGEGKRLQPLIRECFGAQIPKQYCAFWGSKSMLQHTIDRTAKIVRPDRILTVVGNGHLRFLNGIEIHGKLIEQPALRETAPGVFLAGSHLMSQDPQSTVLIFPSDHFVFPEDEFLDQMEQVSSLAERFPEKLFLVGAVPESPETHYGWIKAAGRLLKGDGGPRRVLSFCEKPTLEEAQVWLRLGYLWSTMIVVVKVKTLWSMGRTLLPELMGRFDLLSEMLGATRKGVVKLRNERAFLTELYSTIPPVNFSSAFLSRAVNQSMVWTLSDVTWSDCGCPERLRTLLSRLRSQPPASANEKEAPRLTAKS